MVGRGECVGDGGASCVGVEGLIGLVFDCGVEPGLHGGRGVNQGESMDANLGGLYGKADGGWGGSGLRTVGGCHDVGGDAFFRDHGFEGGDDAVPEVAGGGDEAGVEGDAGLERGGEFGGRPPDEVGEGSGQKIRVRHGLQGEEEAIFIGGKVDV